ncbi:MAG TPA: NYN domain-containing protein [Acidimicrobiia bacterium]|nr:NYN domain-containing protein [Acidimicrobiia bacterium]
MKRGVYPGSFDPLTIAHLAIAHAAIAHGALDRLDFAISRVALGKDAHAQHDIDARLATISRAIADEPTLDVIATDAQLVAEVARGYDVVVMGADKWAQVRDPAWYGDNAAARDQAVADLPRVFVVPRAGFDTTGAESLEIPAHVREVSSTRARAGEHHLIPNAARRRLIVDGNNVVGSTPDGWWRDRKGASRRLVHDLQARAARTGDRIAVVFDGEPLADLPEGVYDGVLVAYASRAGANAADDRIVDEVRRDHEPSSLVVVTSDRELAHRVRELGAVVEGAGSISRARAPERR